MNAEKQFQEVPSRTIQPKVKNDALEMPDNRQMSAMQAKMLETMQRQKSRYKVSLPLNCKRMTMNWHKENLSASCRAMTRKN